MKRGRKVKTFNPVTESQLKRIGEHIRQLRKDKGYSSHEMFAFDHDIARAQFLSYENGRNMELSSLIKIAAAFEMDLKTFFETLPPVEQID
ncbi:helix-turn-helix transcriptional regulator [Dolichospermum circinale CS-541/06]|jgi:transcriptional regulator with XRE-family HTH domain|uniref:helix-turn-helix domain-containing protein n=1 Tax=Dolichospermum circinale TaxID=109265 RepID=UPI00232B9C41|nr:helix-turn-helix transcriptional regulator [Dolichospermum circinale]MDB9455787.1 helix-turn-helix transcriptional regulator [Dolichospermum circinale CS-541/06]